MKSPFELRFRVAIGSPLPLLLRVRGARAPCLRDPIRHGPPHHLRNGRALVTRGLPPRLERAPRELHVEYLDVRPARRVADSLFLHHRFSLPRNARTSRGIGHAPGRIPFATNASTAARSSSPIGTVDPGAVPVTGSGGSGVAYGKLPRFCAGASGAFAATGCAVAVRAVAAAAAAAAEIKAAAAWSCVTTPTDRPMSTLRTGLLTTVAGGAGAAGWPLIG